MYAEPPSLASIWNEMNLTLSRRPLGEWEDSIPRSALATPSRLDWEQHKALIIMLYIDMKKPLSEIIEFMQQNYGFKAT